MKDAFGVQHSSEVYKADKKSSGNPSTGRRVAYAANPLLHVAVTSRKDKRMKNLGRTYGHHALGALGGGVPAAALGAGIGALAAPKLHVPTVGGAFLGGEIGGMAGASAGSHYAGQRNLKHLNQTGRLKAESKDNWGYKGKDKVKKNALSRFAAGAVKSTGTAPKIHNIPLKPLGEGQIVGRNYRAFPSAHDRAINQGKVADTRKAINDVINKPGKLGRASGSASRGAALREKRLTLIASRKPGQPGRPVLP